MHARNAPVPTSARALAVALAFCLGLPSATLHGAPKPGGNDVTTATFRCKGGDKNRSCDNPGEWEFNDGSSRIETRKGHGPPRGWLGMNGPEFIPWVETAMSIESPFHGDFRGRQVQRISFDARTNHVDGLGCEPPNVTQRTMSLEIRNDRGTPDERGDDCGVLANLGLIPQIGEDFIHYDLTVPSGDAALPSTFQVSGLGDGCSGLSADEAWNLVIENVSQVRLCFEQCDFLSIQCNWDLDVDNIEIEAADDGQTKGKGPKS